MFQRILQWIREVWSKMIGQSDVKSKMAVDIAISPVMADALQRWSLMYANQASWLNANTKSLNLPAAIAGEIARAVTIEMQVSFGGGARAEFLAEQFDKVMDQIRHQTEFGCAKGGLFFKPYPSGDGISVDYVQADCAYPVAFDANGHITAAIFSDQRTIGDKYYTRLEYHRMTETGYEITNRAYMSSTKDNLGQTVSLESVDAWKDLLPEATITGVDRPLFAYFRFPSANSIDPTSPLGVSCFARAEDLIQEADKQWSNLLWEFESGQRALYADVLAFDRDEDGKPLLPMKRLYRALKGGGNIDDNPEGLFHDWSPSLREQNILNGLDAIMRKVEFNCGLAYGTFSNPATVDKTATELKMSNQRSYATITDTQKALRNALDQLIYAMDVWATLNKLAPAGKYETTYDFDDSIIVDKDLQFSQDMRLVTGRLMSDIEFRVRNFGETEEKAKEMLAMIAPAPDPFQFGE